MADVAVPAQAQDAIVVPKAARRGGVGFFLLFVVSFIVAVNGLVPLSSRMVQQRCRSSLAASSWEELLNDLVSQDADATAIGTVAREASGKSYQLFTPGPEIWVGSVVALVPIVWASYEFASRVRTQQRCKVCGGSGLCKSTKTGATLSKLRKCYNCGGFLPWLGWRRFFLGTFDVGNGGVLLRPSTEYDANNKQANNNKQAEEASLTDDV